MQQAGISFLPYVSTHGTGTPLGKNHYGNVANTTIAFASSPILQLFRPIKLDVCLCDDFEAASCQFGMPSTDIYVERVRLAMYSLGCSIVVLIQQTKCSACYPTQSAWQ